MSTLHGGIDPGKQGCLAIIGADGAVEFHDTPTAETIKSGKTKLGNERLAHIPMNLVLALANLPRDGNPFDMPVSTARDHWRHTCEAAGIEHLTFHSCRHGFATGLLHAGVDVITVAKLGGWKSAQHVFQTYGHASDDKTVTDRLFDTGATMENAKDG